LKVLSVQILQFCLHLGALLCVYLDFLPILITQILILLGPLIKLLESVVVVVYLFFETLHVFVRVPLLLLVYHLFLLDLDLFEGSVQFRFELSLE
jgi:hypothetical protein